MFAFFWSYIPKNVPRLRDLFPCFWRASVYFFLVYGVIHCHTAISINTGTHLLAYNLDVIFVTPSFNSGTGTISVISSSASKSSDSYSSFSTYFSCSTTRFMACFCSRFKASAWFCLYVPKRFLVYVIFSHASHVP